MSLKPISAKSDRSGVLVALAIAVGVIGVVYAPGAGGHRAASVTHLSQAADSPVTTPAPGPVAAPAVAVAVNAPTLAAAYEENEVAASDRYGRDITLMGVIDRVGKQLIGGEPMLTLRGGAMGVQAELGGSQADSAAKLRKGDRVIMSCKSSSGFAGIPYAHDCVLE